MQPIPVRPVYPTPSLGRPFERLACAAFMSTQPKYAHKSRNEILRELFGQHDPALVQLTRADTTIGTTTGVGWAKEISDAVFGDYLASLPGSAASAVIAAGLRVTLPPNSTTPVGYRRAAGPSPLPWIAEGGAIPVMSGALDGITVTVGKFGVLTVISREAAKRNNGQAAFLTMLREDSARSLDAAYFNAVAGTADHGPGLLYGVTVSTVDTGGGRDAMRNDLATLAGAVSAGGSGTVYFIMSPGRAARVPILSPELGATILPSLAVADDTVIAVDPLSLIHGFAGEPDIDASIEGVVHMSTVPLPIVDASGTAADPTRSLFQTDAVSFRLLADVGFAKRRDGAVAFLNPVWW